MIRAVVLGGTGDVYMMSALFEAFQRQHNRELELVIRKNYACVCELFGPVIRYSCDDKLIDRAEADVTMQRDYDNVIAVDRIFFAHPSFLRTNMRVDHLTTKPDVSQGDMYKIILRIPPDVPLALPHVPDVPMTMGRVIMIPEARSWPNLHPRFWPLLAAKLSYAGWNVQNNAGSGWTLKELLYNCAGAEWVIGPQCGIMSILVTGRFPCRKTLATPDVDGRWLFSQNTFPYAYVTKFSNQDYDVEEYKISEATYGDLADAIVNGSNGLRARPHDPRPICSVMMPLSPGTLLDQFAVLTVKRSRFSGMRRAEIEREFQRYAEAGYQLIKANPEAHAAFVALVDVHARAYDICERVIPLALVDDLANVTPAHIADHVAVIKINRERTTIRRQIDKLMRGPGTEVKSYYDQVEQQEKIEYPTDFHDSQVVNKLAEKEKVKD